MTTPTPLGREGVIVNQKVTAVAANKDKWAALDDKTKLKYLLDMQKTLGGMVEEWGQACVDVRGYKGHPELYGGAYTMGPGLTGWVLKTLIAVYESLVKTGKPPKPIAERTVGDQKVVQVYPRGFAEKMLFSYTSELWLEPGKPATQGACRAKTGVCGILSAGNYECPLDVFTKMFVESKVCVYARHFNLERSNHFIERLFAGLVKDGYLEIVEPGIPYANAVVLHEKVEEVLMTGGAATFDKIVWGSGEAKQKRVRRVCKPVEAELGAVSPYVMVPCDEYSDKEIKHHAGALVGWKLLNSSAICASPQVVITSRKWKQRHAFIDAVVQKLEEAPAIPVFYNGTHDRVNQAKDAYKKLEAVGATVVEIQSAAAREEKYIKPVFVHGLTEAEIDSFSIQNEAFAPVLIELSLDAADHTEFLKKAQEVMNHKLFGSLSCTVMVHDKARKAIGEPVFDEWLRGLEWGTIGINQWGGSGVTLPTGLWGAFPKHSAEDIQSGIGILSNYLMFDHPQKQVLNGPFNDATHPKGAQDVALSNMLHSFSTYTGEPTCWHFTKLAISALKSML